ncbi:MAG: efflux RND transporter periplasmic adaptor subunit [Deltaproteobacteria bacterium]|nr:efflux RND transporter periplasmic adaptor subunit [Deltaproteobacteria bacterium]
MTVKRRPLVAALFAVIVFVLLVIYFKVLRKEKPLDYIESTGVVEATEVDLSSKIPGRIEKLCCEEGGEVKQGQEAVVLESDELKAKLEEGKAAVAAAAEAVKEAKVSVENAVVQRESARYEIDAAKAEEERAKAVTTEAGDNLERAKGLFKDGYAAKKDLDAAQAVYDANRAILDSARARVRSAQANFRNSGVNIRAARARLASSEAKRAQAGAQVKVLKAGLDDTRILSPINGVIAYKAFEAGEYVNPGASIYTIYDLKDVWARVDVEETEVERIRLGDRAEVASTGMPQKPFSGSVIEIGAVGGFATQRDVTRGRSDIKTFRVKAGVERPEGLLKPGMTVRVRIYFAK